MAPSTDEAKYLRAALRLIAGRNCSNYTNRLGTCISHPKRHRTSKYSATRWCDGCIAYDALQRTK